MRDETSAIEILFHGEGLRIGRLVVGALENNVYVVSSDGQAVIIDAADEGHRILTAVADLQVEAVLTTHGHHDHVGAVAEVTERLGVPFRLHLADEALAGARTTSPLRDGEVISVGQHVLTTMHTPGHTPGSVCFHLDGHLFSGDTLFPGGPGATRFPYSDFDQIMRSLGERIFALDDATVIYPGHGATTTVAVERPHIEEWRARRW